MFSKFVPEKALTTNGLIFIAKYSPRRICTPCRRYREGRPWCQSEPWPGCYWRSESPGAPHLRLFWLFPKSLLHPWSFSQFNTLFTVTLRYSGAISMYSFTVHILYYCFEGDFRQGITAFSILWLNTYCTQSSTYVNEFLRIGYGLKITGQNWFLGNPHNWTHSGTGTIWPCTIRPHTIRPCTIGPCTIQPINNLTLKQYGP